MPRGAFAKCEREETAFTSDEAAQLCRLRLEPPGWMFDLLVAEMKRCAAPRALSRMPHLRLITLSRPALQKRPTMREWIGRDLNRIASGVLEEMLDDKELQNAIARREVVCVVSTTSSVLETPEAAQIGSFRTTSSYFRHDGALYSDAISVPVSADEPRGYTPIYADEMGRDLFGDHDALVAAVKRSRNRPSADRSDRFRRVAGRSGNQPVDIHRGRG